MGAELEAEIKDLPLQIGWILSLHPGNEEYAVMVNQDVGEDFDTT